MAIVEMSILRLLALRSEKNALLDALAMTGAVQIKELPEEESSACAEEFRRAAALRAEKLSARVALIRQAAEFAEGKVLAAERGTRAEKLPEGQTLSREDFLALAEKEGEAFALAENILALAAEIGELNNAVTKAEGLAEQAEPYLGFQGEFSALSRSSRVRYALGVLPAEGIAAFAARMEAEGIPAAAEETGTTAAGAKAALFAFPGECAESAESALAEAGFSPCPFGGDETPEQLCARLKEEIRNLNERREQKEKAVCESKDRLPLLRACLDYERFLLEKAEAETTFGATSRTFRLEAYVPKEAEELLAKKLEETTDAAAAEFLPVTEEDNPPTLMRNPAPVKQFEFVTNMYSPPNYRELDPNPAMSFFFLLFFGFIMADVGYGVLLALGAGALALRKKKDTGGRRLLWILSMGGVTTALFGLLFGSFFGFTHAQWSVIPPSVMPDPQAESQKLLIWCLLAGAAQIFFGFFLKGVQLARRKRIADALFDGFIWCLFFAGAAAALRAARCSRKSSPRGGTQRG